MKVEWEELMIAIDFVVSVVVNQAGRFMVDRKEVDRPIWGVRSKCLFSLNQSNFYFSI